MTRPECGCAACAEARALKAAHTRIARLEATNAELRGELERALVSVAVEVDARRAVAGHRDRLVETARALRAELDRTMGIPRD